MKNSTLIVSVFLVSITAGIMPADTNSQSHRKFALGLGVVGAGCAVSSDAWWLRLCGLVLAGTGVVMYHHSVLGDMHRDIREVKQKIVDNTAVLQQVSRRVDELHTKVDTNHEEVKSGLALLVTKFNETQQLAEQRHTESIRAITGIQVQMRTNQAELLQAISALGRGAVVTRASLFGFVKK